MTPIPVTLIAGFLGSGKTTLMRRIVRDERHGPGTAVLVNEIGALGLDEDLILAERSTEALYMRQLVSGCICCTLRGDLADALLALTRGAGGPAPQRILIETSGAARASEVSYAVNAIGFEAPVATDAVITLVDAWNARRAHVEHEELFADQVRSADLVLLNKIDLVVDEQARASLSSLVRELAPRATLLHTVHADVPLDLLLDTGVHQGAPSAPSAHTHGLSALTCAQEGLYSMAKLEDLLEELSDTLFRIKGVVDVATPEGPAPLLVQAVGDRIDLSPVPPGSPLSRSGRRLTFIGAAPERERERIEQRLRTIQIRPEG